ncbi:MAG: sce7726 family protein [Pseudomonadota bacterium]|nr:sce7726 family protein [Pseudomonadota bacterium]
MTQLLADADIRPALRARLAREHARRSDTDTVVVDELGLCMGTVRADLAVVNGVLHGYEIKSDRDSLVRLPRQIEVYGRVFDRVTLVVGERHLASAQALIPDWWAVLRIDGPASRPRLREARRGRRNPARDARALVELLWSDEAMALLEARGLARGVRGKPRAVVWDRVCAHLTLDEIAGAVRERLKATAGQRGSPPSQ